MEKLNGEEFYLHDDPFYESYVPENGYDHETDPWNLEYVNLGEFSVDHNINEEGIGIFRAPEKFKVCVYGNEGERVPHCHLQTDDGNPDICIKLENAEYFIHGHHKRKLTNKQAKAFYEFMLSSSKRSLNRWEFACESWDNLPHQLYQCKDVLHIPRYDLINNPTYYQYQINGVELFWYMKQFLHETQWKDFLYADYMRDIFNMRIFHDYNIASYRYLFKFEGYEMFEKYALSNIKKLLLPQVVNELKLVELKNISDSNVKYSDAYQIITR